MPTTNLGFDLLAENQAAAEVTFNDTMYKLDAIVQAAAEDRDLNTPPTGPTADEGDVYIVGTNASGAWDNRENQIAQFISSAWRFIPPTVGMQVWMKDETTWVFWDGDSWEIARMDSISGQISAPANQVYCLDLSASEAYKITELWGMTSAGTCTIGLKRGGADANGHTTGSTVGNTRACTTTRNGTTQSTPVAVAKDQKLFLNVTSTSSAADLTFSLHIIRSRS